LAWGAKSSLRGSRPPFGIGLHAGLGKRVRDHPGESHHAESIADTAKRVAPVQWHSRFMRPHSKLLRRRRKRLRHSSASTFYNTKWGRRFRLPTLIHKQKLARTQQHFRVPAPDAYRKRRFFLLSLPFAGTYHAGHHPVSGQLLFSRLSDNRLLLRNFRDLLLLVFF
jgi:hypothetical protein